MLWVKGSIERFGTYHKVISDSGTQERVFLETGRRSNLTEPL